jgi:hypothetical protein
MMKAGQFGSTLPSQSVLLALLCGVAALVFIVLVILPSQKQDADLDADIAALKTRIEEQKILLPVFKGLLEKTKTVAPAGLPAPAKGKLARPEIARISKRLQDMARAHQLTAREITLDVNTATDSSGRLMVRFLAYGQFLDLRNFLIELGALPFFDSIEDLDIRASEGGETIGMKIWLARE